MTESKTTRRAAVTGPASAEARHWACVAARAADDKQATDPVVLDVGDVLGITDCFVICSAGNPRLVRTVADEIEERIAAAGGPKPLRSEGRDELTWVLIDYGFIVVHVFSDENRRFYDLERLWRDVPRLDWRAEVPAAGSSAAGSSVAEVPAAEG